MSTHFLSDEPAYAICPAADSHDSPFQIRIAVEDLAVSIRTSLVALSLDDALTQSNTNTPASGHGHPPDLLKLRNSNLIRGRGPLQLLVSSSIPPLSEHECRTA